LEKPFKVEWFDKTSRQEITGSPEKLVQNIPGQFGLQAGKIAAALSFIQWV
jgi:hypothetical protein